MRNFSTVLPSHSVCSFYRVNDEYYRVPSDDDMMDICRKLVALFEDAWIDYHIPHFTKMIERLKLTHSMLDGNVKTMREEFWTDLNSNRYGYMIFNPSEYDAIFDLLYVLRNIVIYHDAPIKLLNLKTLSFFYANLNTGRALNVMFTYG